MVADYMVADYMTKSSSYKPPEAECYTGRLGVMRLASDDPVGCMHRGRCHR
jgi:hypothetical protein